MRSGRHFARFTVVGVGVDLMFGVIPPGYDVEGGALAYNVDGNCLYDTASGRRFPGRRNWEGRQGAREAREAEDCAIGILLNLDQRSMSVWTEERREAGGDGGRGAEGSAVLGGLAVLAGRQRAPRVGAGTGVADGGAGCGAC